MVRIKPNWRLLRCKRTGLHSDDCGRSIMTRKKSSGKPKVRRVPMRDFSRSLPMSLLRAREAVMGHFRASLRDHGLTEQQWRILRALAAIDAIEVTELARVAFLLGPSLSRILRALEERHLIVREGQQEAMTIGCVTHT